MEAISMAGTVLAILSKEGVVMVAEKVRTSTIDVHTDFI
jgi:20S proteasome alpha/beta subunit